MNMLRCSVYTPDGNLCCWKLVGTMRSAENYKRGLTELLEDVTVTIEPNHTYKERHNG